MARFIRRRRYPPFKRGSIGEFNERLALTRSRTRVTLDEQGRSLAVSDDAKNTFEEWGRNPDEVEQNFREWWYSDKPEELQERIRETEVPVKSKTIVENFMIPDKTKPKKGRGGLLKLHRAKKRQKLIKNMRRLLRRVDRLEDSPMKYKILDNMEKEIRRTKPKKKNMGGLLSLYE